MPMRSFFFRLGAAAIGVMLLTSAYHRLNSSSLMAEAANRFLASLTPEQRAKATFAFEEDERQNWHFVPIERKGLALREMTSAQKHLATALLAAGLSQQGYLKAETVMSLEDVLRIIEHGTGPDDAQHVFQAHHRFRLQVALLAESRGEQRRSQMLLRGRHFAQCQTFS